MKHFRQFAFATLAVALWVSTSTAWAGCSTPFSRIVVFGDSLSDNGNFYRITGDIFPTSPPYWEGRFCNGPVWVEYLAQDLGMEGLVEDYAVGGASTGEENVNDPSPFGGVKTQITHYLSSQRGDPEALYVLWAGHNDLFIALGTGTYDLSQVVPNTIQNIRTLWAAGARHFMVVNLADVGKTPMILSSDSGEFVSGLVRDVNESLARALRKLSAEGIHTVPVDSFAFLDRVVARPSKFAFSNVTDPGIALYPAESSGYLFWDDVHPTTQFHEEFEQVALSRLMECYPNRCNHRKSTHFGNHTHHP